MKLCYCDESGTGSEPIATMVGILVDSHRMHLTKKQWDAFLLQLGDLSGRQVMELHTKELYHGKGQWHGLDWPTRSAIITASLEWLAERKHYVVYTSVMKNAYNNDGDIPEELKTPWRFLGMHLVLAIQKHAQSESKNKGHTIFIFDNQEKEKVRFADIVVNPPEWSDAYYGRKKKKDQLDQVVDVPYFGDSKDVALIQMADAGAFLFRRYAQIKEGLTRPRYCNEEKRLTEWVDLLRDRAISTTIYPKKGRQKVDELFFRNAPPSIAML